MSPIIGNEIIKLSSTESTNNYASSRIYSEGWQEGKIVHSLFQDNGRGQPGNCWESEPGKNLLCSIVLKPVFLPIKKQFLLSKVVALSISDLLSNYVGKVNIKWPNDIYINDKKIAGVLIENSIMGNVIEYSVAGIGLNVNQLLFSSNVPNPTSLALLSKDEFDVDILLNKLTGYLNKWYSMLADGAINEIDELYSEKLYRKGELCPYSDSGGTYSGTVLGVNETGQLLIEDEAGQTRKYNFREVVFLNTNP